METEFVLFVSAAIFSIGALGFVVRKNPLVMFMVCGTDAERCEFSSDRVLQFFEIAGRANLCADYYDRSRGRGSGRSCHHSNYFPYPA